MTEMEKAEVCPNCSGQLRQREYMRITDLRGNPELTFDITIYCSNCDYQRKETPVL